MGRTTRRELTTAEAKERLRRASGAISPGVWMREHTQQTILFGLLAGLILGRFKSLTRSPLAAYGLTRLIKRVL